MYREYYQRSDEWKREENFCCSIRIYRGYSRVPDKAFKVYAGNSLLLNLKSYSTYSIFEVKWHGRKRLIHSKAISYVINSPDLKHI